MSVGAIIDSDAQSYQDLKSFKKSSKKCAELYIASAYFNTLASISDKSVIGGNATEKALSASLLAYPFEKEIKDNVKEIINYIDETKKENKIKQENTADSFMGIVLVVTALSGVGLALLCIK